MAITMAKHIRQRYLDDQENVIEEVEDPDGAHPLPVKDSVIFLGGRRYKIACVSFDLDVENRLLKYDAMVREV